MPSVFQPTILGIMSKQDHAWPPLNTPRSLSYYVLRLQCIFNRNYRMVWLRDIDGEQTLTVAKPSKDGIIAPRFWPRYRFMKLHDNGLVESVLPKDNEYVVHWIAENESEKMMMFLKNHAVYNDFDK